MNFKEFLSERATIKDLDAVLDAVSNEVLSSDVDAWFGTNFSALTKKVHKKVTMYRSNKEIVLHIEPESKDYTARDKKTILNGKKYSVIEDYAKEFELYVKIDNTIDLQGIVEDISNY